MVQLDSRSADMLNLYRGLKEIVREPATKDQADVADAFAVLDAIAGESWLRKRRLPVERALLALLNVYWLEHNRHLATAEHNGMWFLFSRAHPTEPGQRVGFGRHTRAYPRSGDGVRTRARSGERRADREGARRPLGVDARS
jgi:hypothetical protein